MATEIPRGNGEPGTWRPWVAHTPEPDFQPHWAATVRCPGCGQRMSLAKHTIDASGNVTPSIGHPDGIPECGWHPSDARLVGWAEALREPLPPTPNLETCAKCGYQAHTIGGWGTDGRYVGGVICFKCVAERDGRTA